jgi:ferredoxin, 2Fe-2S
MTQMSSYEVSKEDAMPIVTIMPSGAKVEVVEGSTLLAAIKAAGQAIGNKCDGNADCGTCHIFVLEGRKGISKIGFAENAKLDSIVGVGSKSRLACQALVKNEDVTVELLGFASGF